MREFESPSLRHKKASILRRFFYLSENDALLPLPFRAVVHGEWSGSFLRKELGAALRNTEYAAFTEILRLRLRMTMVREGNPVMQSDV